MVNDPRGRFLDAVRVDPLIGAAPRRPSTVTLDVEIIHQWLDWLDTEGEYDDNLRADLTEVLAHPERCQPRPLPLAETVQALEALKGRLVVLMRLAGHDWTEP